MTLDTRYSNELYNMWKKADSTWTEQLQFDYKGTSEMVDGQWVQKTYSSVTATSEALNRALSVVVSGDIATWVDISKITNAHEQPNSLCRSEADITARWNFPWEHNIITYTDKEKNQYRVVYDNTGSPVKHMCEWKFVTVSVCTANNKLVPYLEDATIEDLQNTPAIEAWLVEFISNDTFAPTPEQTLSALYSKLNAHEDMPFVHEDDHPDKDWFYKNI